MKHLFISGLLLTAFWSCQSANEDTPHDDYAPTEYILETEDGTASEIDMLESEQNYRSSLSKNEKSIKTQYNVTAKDSKVSQQQKKKQFDTKIIRTADAKLKVENVEMSTTKIENYVQMKGGYIANQDLHKDKHYYRTVDRGEDFTLSEYEITTTNIMVIRIPNNEFDGLLKDIKGVSIYEDFIRISSKDVTEEYVDLETRLKTKKEVEQRYIDILRNKAKTVEDILIAEEKIRMIREEIESVQGRLNYLKNRVSLSTVQVELYNDPVYIQEKKDIEVSETVDAPGFWSKAGKAISTGWDGILGFIIILIYLWPFFLIAGLVLWFFRRRRKKKKQA